MNDDKCLKCGFDLTVSEAIDKEWGYWTYNTDGTYSRGVPDSLHDEAIKCTCVCCGFEWLIETEDA